MALVKEVGSRQDLYLIDGDNLIDLRIMGVGLSHLGSLLGLSLETFLLFFFTFLALFFLFLTLLTLFLFVFSLGLGIYGGEHRLIIHGGCLSHGGHSVGKISVLKGLIHRDCARTIRAAPSGSGFPGV